MTVDSILKEARSQIGISESPKNSNKTKYGKWYGLDGQPWCCMFICWLFRTEPSLIKKTASCSQMASWFKSKGRFYTSAQPGDLCFMNFGNKNAFASHIGIVESVNGDTVVTIEGNTSGSGSQDNGGSVLRKTRKAYIVGYGRPNYAKSLTRPTLRVGSKGANVLYLHQFLKYKGYGVDPNSDLFTENTKTCVMHLQASNGLQPDGIVGTMTWGVIDD